MKPVEFDQVIEHCDRVLVAAHNAMAAIGAHPLDADDEAGRRVTLLCVDVVAVIGAADTMLRRPFVDGRGAVLRRIVETGMVATSETAATIELWGTESVHWTTLATECGRCTDAMRSLLSQDVHDTAGLSGST
jgi:hypothetical protein